MADGLLDGAEGVAAVGVDEGLVGDDGFVVKPCNSSQSLQSSSLRGLVKFS